MATLYLLSKLICCRLDAPLDSATEWFHVFFCIVLLNFFFIVHFNSFGTVFNRYATLFVKIRLHRNPTTVRQVNFT